METQQRNTPENVNKLISLLYMHTQEIGFAEFNAENTCGIYNVDPHIMTVLKDLNAIKHSDKSGKDKYSWGSTYPTNEFMAGVHKTLLNYNSNNQQKPKVMKRTNNPVTQETKQAVVDTMHLPIKEAALIIDRTYNMTSYLRTIVRQEGLVDESVVKSNTKGRKYRKPRKYHSDFKESPVQSAIATPAPNRGSRKNKAWNKEDTDFLIENSGKSNKWLARNLGRTVHSVKNRRYVIAGKKSPIVEEDVRRTLKFIETHPGFISLEDARRMEDEAYNKGKENALLGLSKEISSMEIEKKPERIRRVRILFGFLLDLQW